MPIGLLELTLVALVAFLVLPIKDIPTLFTKAGEATLWAKNQWHNVRILLMEGR